MKYSSLLKYVCLLCLPPLFLAVLAKSEERQEGLVVTRMGSFDFEKNLKVYFVAQQKLKKTILEGTPEEEAAAATERKNLFEQYGIKSEREWARIGAHAGSYIGSTRGQKHYGGLQSINQLRTQAMEEVLGKQKSFPRDRKFDDALLEPIEGVSLEDYARVCNRLASLKSQEYDLQDQVLEKEINRLGIKDFERWFRIHNLWIYRMGKDRSMNLTQLFSKHFFAASQGVFSAAGKEMGKSAQPIDVDKSLSNPSSDDNVYMTVKRRPPVPLEKYVEIQEAMTLSTERQEDVTKVLSRYRLTVQRWAIISNWWGAKLRESANGDVELFVQWRQLQKKYRQKLLIEKTSAK